MITSFTNFIWILYEYYSSNLFLILLISLLILLPIDDHQYLMPYQIKNDVLKKFQPMFDISCCLNIDEAIKHVKQKFTHGKILICGSLYLAGEVLRADGYKIKWFKNLI